MSEFTYEDFKSRLSIQTVLEDAGYHFDRRQGLRNPVYVKLDGDGRRVHGNKFVVRNGAFCFKPPERRCYNVISLIKEFPEMFADYKPGMNLDRLVNLVCNRLLNNPTVYKQYDIKEDRPAQVFDESIYEIKNYDLNDWDSRKAFYPFFKDRGLDLKTQAAFADYFVLAKNMGREDGKQYTNLSFLFRIPNDEKKVVGYEERGYLQLNFPGAKTHRGKAMGTNSVDGLWFANLSGKPLAQAERVLWFESAYDAMAYYQIHREKGEDTKGVYASTGGSPSEKQFSGLIAACPRAMHHLCFDRDHPGQMYACTFAAVKDNRLFSSYSMKNGTIVFVDKTDGRYDRHEIARENFSYQNFCKEFGIHDSQTVYHPAAEGYKDWNDQLLGKRMKVEEAENIGKDERKVSDEGELSSKKMEEKKEEKRGYGFGR
jgi:hypothetical protein